MLTIEQLLKNLILTRLYYTQYGMCTQKLDTIIKCASSYHWLVTKVYSCLSACQLETIETFILENRKLIKVGCTDFPAVNLGTATADPVEVTCLLVPFNLESFITGSDTSGTWEEITTGYTSNGGTITNTTLGTVDFTSIPNGNYTFRKKYLNTTGNCSKWETTVLNIIKQPNVGQC